MIPWDRLPKDVQRVLLALMMAYGGSASAACLPRVCDPPPPPSIMPRPTSTAIRTPMICDPPPPPRTATPTVTSTATTFRTPMICDPAPPPSRTSTATPARTPMICDPPPPPARTPTATTTPTATVTTTVTPVAGNTGGSGQAATGDPAGRILPLAEIRSVQIAWVGGLRFRAETPWSGAHLRWTVSGGALGESGPTTAEAEEAVTWVPAAAPGRYLLQVVADWGPAGLAVDSVVLVTEADGSVTFG
jgi:hypothetical protein